MKTIFEERTVQELFDRIDHLSNTSERQWGKMTATQAMEHTARALEMALGDKPVKQLLIGKLISPFFKKSFLGEKQMPKNAPTRSTFIVKEEPDFEATRERLKATIISFQNAGESGTDGKIHGFFGVLTGRQWGETQYKHVDHHLRQFGV